MNTLSHQFRRARFSILLMIALACVYASVNAQQPAPRKPARQQALKPPAAQNKDDDAKRRAQAIAVLNETAYTARLLDDLVYRARVQALVADALWSSDEQTARTIFRRAWDAATAADKADQKALEDESVPVSDSENYFVGDARDELLIKVAARDSQLANLFLQEYQKDRYADKSEQQTESQQRRTPWGRLSAGGQRRLALAHSLLYRNEPERAAQIAAPVINEGASGGLMELILHLREQSPAQAEALYDNLLKRTRTDATADANSVLLLSSFVISPQLLVVVDDNGSLEFRTITLQTTEPQKLPPPSATARTLFYDLAATILARPVVPRPDANPSRAAVALYFTLNRLLPYFEREAPQYAPEMQARQGALVNEVGASRRDQLSAQAGLTSLTPVRADDPLKPQMEKLSRTSEDDTERDGVLQTLIQLSVEKRYWDRARRFAAELKDQKIQHDALTYIAVGQIEDITRAYANDKEGEFEYLATFIRGADVPPFAAAWGLAQTALIAARGGRIEPASDLFDEAERYAARIEMGTDTRVAAYAALASYAARIDQARAWRLLAEAVKAANSVKDFIGDERTIELGVDENASEEAESLFNISADEFRLDRIFATMARLDFEKALAEARGLRGKIPQALAHIAVARATLEKK
jgi:hypothetical protein